MIPRCWFCGAPGPLPAEALAELREKLLRWTRRQLSNDLDLAEDVVQQTIAELIEKCRASEVHDATAFAWTIARNRVADIRRNRWKDRSLQDVDEQSFHSPKTEEHADATSLAAGQATPGSQLQPLAHLAMEKGVLTPPQTSILRALMRGDDLRKAARDHKTTPSNIARMASSMGKRIAAWMSSTTL